MKLTKETEILPWNKPIRMAGTFLLIVSPLIALLLLRPYWFNLAIAAILTLFLRPLAGLLQRRLHLNRTAAVLCSMLLLLALMAIPFLLLPALISSLSGLIEFLADWADTVTDGLIEFLQGAKYIDVGGVVVDLSAIVDPAIKFLNTTFLDFLAEAPEEAIRLTIILFGAALSGIGSLISLIITVTLTLTFTLYMLLDLSWLRQGLRFAVPASVAVEVQALLPRLFHVWGAYIRGQLGVMLAIGAIVTAAMLLLGIRYALALGFIAAILEVIPHLGPILAAVPAVIVALFQGSVWIELNHLLLAILVGLVYLAIQQVEDNFLTPRIQGKAVEIPPLVIMLSVMVGLHEFGLLGGILAVPVVVTAREILRYIKERIVLPQPVEPQPISTLNTDVEVGQ